MEMVGKRRKLVGPVIPGSWVSYCRNGYGGVARVGNVYGVDFFDIYTDYETISYVPFDSLEGIGITECILTKNGFVRDGDVSDDDGSIIKSFHLKDDENVWGYLEKGFFGLRLSGGDAGEGLKISNVNSLQVALYLAGHKELSMNFKV